MEMHMDYTLPILKHTDRRADMRRELEPRVSRVNKYGPATDRNVKMQCYLRPLLQLRAMHLEIKMQMIATVLMSTRNI